MASVLSRCRQLVSVVGKQVKSVISRIKLTVSECVNDDVITCLRVMGVVAPSYFLRSHPPTYVCLTGL